MKKHIERVKLDGVVKNEDFVVVSKVVMTEDFSFLPFEEGANYPSGTLISETFFPDELVDFVYDVGPTVDISLAVTLGLGVIKSLTDGNLYLYHADNVDGEDREIDENLRLGMYYQIMNREYDDRKLNDLLETPGGEYYLRMLFLCDLEQPMDRLKEIFAEKKGKNSNVVEFFSL